MLGYAQHSVDPQGFGYRIGNPVALGYGGMGVAVPTDDPSTWEFTGPRADAPSEPWAVATLEELVTGAEATIADISRAIERQVPEGGWWPETASRWQNVPGAPAGSTPVVASRAPWGLIIGGVAVLAGLGYLALRKG